MTQAPRASLAFATPDIETVKRDNGEVLLSSRDPLGDYDTQVSVWLRRWAEKTPEATFLAERDGSGGWRRLSYAEARKSADAVSQALLDRGLGPDRPVMILSGNAVDHGILALGAMQVGVPVVPVSPAYSLMSQDHAKIKHIFGLVRPGLIYVEAIPPFAAALGAVDLTGVEVVTVNPIPDGPAATPFDTLLAVEPTSQVAERLATVSPDTIAKYLFTSGSTGLPKGVINTQRMLCSDQQLIRQVWPFLEEEPPVLVDWLPWNHTFGSNHDFNMVLTHGGTLYIDGGKPAPGLIEQTVANIGEISPTIYFNVPAGFGALLPFLERDPGLCETFFKNLKLIFYAGAALPQDLWDRLEALSIRTLGKRVIMLSAWGSTETAPGATYVHWPIERAGVIGLPGPGVEIKMVPAGGKMELRVKGPIVTPGYLNQPDLTEAAFDDEGFYRIGDAGRLADPDDPTKGLVFDGRVAEDFKLITGTWVHAGGIRVAALAAATPLLQDAVVAGHDQGFVSLLAWPNLAAAKDICSDPTLADDIPALLRSPDVVAHVRAGIAAYNRDHPGSSTRVARVLLMAEPPSIDANEITDKGYINQNATLERRHNLVDKLYAETPDEDVIVID